MALATAPADAAPAWQGGTLLYAGGTDWAQMGRTSAKIKKDPKVDAEREKLYPNLLEPTKLKPLSGIKIMFVAGGAAAVHCMAGDVNGNLYTWGRNEKGQLGHGDLLNRFNPRLVEALQGKFISSGTGGRHHTLVITREGEAWAWGLNQQGQLGLGSIKKGTVKGFEDVHTAPVKVLLEGTTTMCAAGIDFSMWIADGKLYSAGNPQHGQTGDGSDHSYNAKESAIAIVYEPQPTPKQVPALADKTVTRVACGHTHTIAVDDAGSCYTWGNGGYGRLGHRVQKDEHAPRKVEEFKGRISIPKDAIVAANASATLVTALIGGAIQQLYSWGKLKTSGDNQMYPLADQNMSGWNVRSIACGPQHFAIAADQSAITWGFAFNGELAYGPHGKKTSANAGKVDLLEGMLTHQVAAGVGFTMFLVDPEAPQLAKLAEFESSAPDSASKGDDEGEAAPSGKGGKRGKSEDAGSGGGGASKRGKK